MAKFFLVLTLIAAAVAGYLGFQTYQQIDKVGKTLQTTRTTLKTTQGELVKTQQELADTKTTLAKSVADLAEANATIQTQKTQIDQLTTQNATLTQQLGEETDKYTKLKALYDALNPNNQTPGNPTNPDDVWKQKLAEMQKHIDELTTVNTTLTKRAEEAEKHSKELVEKEEKRQANLIRKGVEGIVMAVNPGYGFVVISLGDKQGAVPDAEVIVERDGHQIATLKITTVEPVLSVADIIPESLAKGQRVLPGDKVIFTGNKVGQAAQQPQGAAPVAPLPQP
ncbi:MAG TPA: hypothetical protein VG733_17035 [Chthoniobacteraceae bacterium]|nr:hypothetical protein [Chthoniobacteraceae bacterium]